MKAINQKALKEDEINIKINMILSKNYFLI